ncbi:MAG: chemotaxis protein [Desulfosporosinus sp. BRH_c37]|nr:MAG: chemotaxis protein [Desulfosporosinus sp. BRH_c37]
MRTKEVITADLVDAKERNTLYRNREKEMLSGGVQSYGIGPRNLARYNTDLSVIRTAIKELKQEITELESELIGGKPRRAVGVVLRDW